MVLIDFDDEFPNFFVRRLIVEIDQNQFSPGELAQKGVFVGKKYGKAETSQKVSYGYVEPPKKSPWIPVGNNEIWPFL